MSEYCPRCGEEKKRNCSGNYRCPDCDHPCPDCHYVVYGTWTWTYIPTRPFCAAPPALNEEAPST